MVEEPWNWNQRGEAPVNVAVQDACFVLACCYQWVPNGDIAEIITWDHASYQSHSILWLLGKMLPLLTGDDSNAWLEIPLTVGEISYILHFLRGDDSYGGGATFQKALLKALWELVRTE
mgnify:FL=1